jgi:nucleoside-diphosphate-sugar epimerase
MTAVWVVGCGYVGTRVARAEQAEGNTVTVMVRTAESAHRLAELGLHAVQHDLDQPSLSGLNGLRSVVYYFAPPPSRGTTDPRLARFLAALGQTPHMQRLVLISTSGVYGDCHGEWVTEARAAHPEAERAHRRWDAEQTAHQWSARTGVPVVILRVPGIYGPGRLPLERLRAGEPVLNEAESPWSNRVHVDDLVMSCLAAARRGRPGAVYNISDGTPTTMTDYFNRVADATGLPRPPQISLSEAGTRLSTGMRSYLAESKRLDNRAMCEELGVTPRYPDLASGLAACLSAEAAA